MIANPFARALSASAISVPGGLQGGLVNAYRASPAGYIQIYQTPGAGQQGALATWQGVFAETVNTTAPTFTFDFTAAVPATPPFISRGVPTDALALTLAGTTADGVETRDEAATVRFAPEATTGWDVLDGSKLTPPAGTYALVAPVGTRDGAAYRQGVLSLPAATGDVTLAFTATHAGTYTLTADAAGLPATATLHDLVTGAIVDLAAGYTFTSDATDWTERFVVSFGRATAGEEVAAERTLTAPRPNPATARASLTLRLPAAEHVRATVVDALGRTVATLYDAEAPAGADVALDIDTARLAPGVYVVRVQGASFTESRRLTVVR